MLMSIFILPFILGLVSSQDDYDKFRECRDLLKLDEAHFEHLIPNAREVLVRCQPIKRFMDCRISHYSPEFDPQYNLRDYIIIREFLDEICDDKSQLHKAYVENYDCFKSVIDESNGCSKVASDAIEEYRTSSFAVQNTDIEELDEEEREDIINYRFYKEHSCLVSAYFSACVGEMTLEKCGSDAFDTYAEVFQGIRVATDFCGKEPENPYLNGFLEFLKSDGKLAENGIIRTLYQIDED